MVAKYRVVATTKSQSYPVGAFSRRVITGVQLSVGTHVYPKSSACGLIESKQWALYTVDRQGREVPISVHHLNGSPYLITEADGQLEDNLLKLPDAPIPV